MPTPEQKYSQLKEKYQSEIAEQTRRINWISNLRLIVFLLAAVLGMVLLVKKSYGLFGVGLGLFLIVFVYLMTVHESYFKKKKYTTMLLQINKEAIQRIRGEWHAFADDGKEFLDDNHPYSQDLDLFGQGGLFQFINTAKTYLGRIRLREILISTPKTVEIITEKQEAVRELAAKLEFRQQYQAEAMLTAKMHNPAALISWAREIDAFYRTPWIIFICRFLPVLTVVIGVLTYLKAERNYLPLIVALLVQLVITRINAGKRGKALGVAAQYMENIRVYSKMIGLLEKQNYHSPYLTNLISGLKDKKGQTACAQIDKLAGIVDRIGNRNNMFFLVLNVLFLLDYEYMFALEKWKAESGNGITNWLETIAECEALASLAVLPYDHPEWAMPIVSRGMPSPVFAAEAMGHPLLTKSSVANDLEFAPPRSILLITGSNMSGKSTLLRTVGINLVLAYAGTAVCAKTFQCSLMEIYTCMRVNDNLEKNISAFYAELLRIKEIVRAVEEGKTIFFLLDEIFKGTNSIDRHTGAKVLIKKFAQANILGLISTHDLELGELEKESSRIKNYHFQEYYVNGQISFDYKLRDGVSKTRNAAYLMKMAGIDVTE
ncbi:DNA mismatch repair protein [Dehalobacter sp. DCM]|uniref:MutS family DNA mismatch repair protein n=1 Tax=Dehalobacter sp. DCM TaxID=2907827 RepID=UPI003081A686|nr:DNA mismatch repair protein [Dehalobacter sp. DCM]